MQLLRLDLPFDLELAEVGEKRRLFGCQVLGFALQRGETIARTPGERFGTVGVAGLGGKRGGECEDNRDEPKTTAFHLYP